MDENIKITKQCVEYARSVAQRKKEYFSREAELGYIGSSSKFWMRFCGRSCWRKNLTTVEDAKRFVTETGVDLFSPAIGSIHGALKSTHDPV